MATISVHEGSGTSPTLSWPVASTSDNKGRRHTLENADSEERRSTSQLSPTPLVGSVISLCSSGMSEGGSYRSPTKSRITPSGQAKAKYMGPPIRMISAESSDDASAPSVTVIPADNDDDDDEANQACGGVVIEEIANPLEDELSICDVQLSEDYDDKDEDIDNSMLWYVEEEESATSTNGLLRNYPELRSQPGLDTVSWTASDDFSSTTISGTLSGAEAGQEDSGGQEVETLNPPQPSSSSQCISVSQSSSLRMLGLEGVEEEEMEDVLVVDPNDQKAVLIIGTRRCTGMPVTGEDNIGHCITKPPDQC